MNKAVRKSLQDVIEQIEAIKEVLEDIQSIEEDKRDGIPENMQSSERYEKADAACENIASAVESLDEAIDYITEASE